ncbi:hypothetical protein [Mycobacterium shigaense]|nr:hypothetical protein [Mycobacterium shigaense]MEA1123518.1 hypothetical protein [Mycobacterium shigaense]
MPVRPDWAAAIAVVLLAVPTVPTLRQAVLAGAGARVRRAA